MAHSWAILAQRAGGSLVAVSLGYQMEIEKEIKRGFEDPNSPLGCPPCLGVLVDDSSKGEAFAVTSLTVIIIAYIISE